MQMYMRADPMFWIVPASVAMAVGTTAALLTILQHNLILRIIKNLTRLANLIDKYSDDPPPKDWQIVRYNADRSRKQTEELGKKIVLDFTQIIDSVENPRLADKFGANNLYYTLYLIDEILRIDPEHDKEPLRELRKGIREQIGKLDGALSLLEEEGKENNYR